MHRLPAAFAIIAVSLLLACSGPAPDPEPKVVAWNAEVPQSTELAGQEMIEEKSGPWTVRKTARPAGSERARDLL